MDTKQPSHMPRPVEATPWIRALLATALTTAAPVSAYAAVAVPSATVLAKVTLSDIPVSQAGISGLDYQPRTGTWLLLSDARTASHVWPARITFDNTGQPTVKLGQPLALRDAAGRPYAPEARDPEALRFDPCGDRVYWTSEQNGKTDATPLLQSMALDGRETAKISLPPAWKADAKVGGQANTTLEGLALTRSCDGIWLALENPLAQDGDRLKKGLATEGFSRLTLIDRTGRVTRQIAYALDPLKSRKGEIPEDAGISEILLVDDTRLLVLERTGGKTAGVWGWHSRLYLVDLTTAPDVSGIASFRTQPPTPVRKELIVDFDDLPAPVVSNLEAMAWSPPQAGGAPDLVVVSDNNFEVSTELLVVRLPRSIACAAPGAACKTRPGP